MTIMVAGGLTFAIPGMEPAHAAGLSNPHLAVSAELLNTGNVIATTNIVEIVVSDGDVNESGDELRVTVDGADIEMAFFSGAWYAYIASAGIQNTGLIVQLETDMDGIVSGTETVDGDGDAEITEAEQTAINNLVMGEPAFATDNAPAQLVQVLNLDDGTFDIVYEKPANPQTVVLDLDDPSESASLDRSLYPQGTGVIITLDDLALNVDPTSDDVWYLGSDGTSYYRGIPASVSSTAANAEALAMAGADRTTANAKAVTDRDTKIAEAVTDRDAKIAAAVPATAIAAAVDKRDLLITRANEVVDDPTVPLEQAARAQSILGDKTIDFDDPPTAVQVADYKGIAQIEYEVIAGFQPIGDITVAPSGYVSAVDDDLNTHYGSDNGFTYPSGTDDATVASGIADANYATVNGDKTETEITSVAYKGTAQVAYEVIAGDGPGGNVEGSAHTEYTADLATATQAHTDAVAAAPTIDADVDGGGIKVSTDEGFSLSTNNNGNVALVECVESCSVSSTGEFLIEFSEDSSNDSVFTNAPGDTPNIRTTTGADRGLSFSVTYDNTTTSSIGFGETNIVIDAGDEWNSGENIGITLTDSDANTNSLNEDNLSVTAASHIIPTITIGTPFTLGGDDNGRVAASSSGSAEGTLVIPDGTFEGVHMLNYDVSALGSGASVSINGIGVTVDRDGRDLVDVTGHIGSDNTVNIRYSGTASDGMIVIDVFSFGLIDGTDNVNNAIYRLELEEKSDNSSDFTGTLEYIGLNQVNILDATTYAAIQAIDVDIILISDDDSVSVDYLDKDANGQDTLFTAEADTPTHSGAVSLDSDGYKVADTVTVTVEDADLNVDSGKPDVYTTIASDIVGAETSNEDIGELLSVSIDGNQWAAGCTDMTGLDATDFTLKETGDATGVFTGTFAVPADYCHPNGKSAGVTGADISVEYIDFRDDSGSTITVSDSAGIRSNTGSVSLDRTVYPVPIGIVTEAEDDTAFETFGADLLQHDLTVYVSISDSDFDTSSNGIDSTDPGVLEISIIRGSETLKWTVEDAIDETAPNSGVFEHTETISYNTGPDSSDCPPGLDGCIVQGDILHVQYTDPSDASGSLNTVTDSATFDLRNGVLQVDRPGTTGYVIGSDMIVTLIEQDLNLDSDATETYTLDLIEWDSDAGTCSLKSTGCTTDPFGATPSNLLETGTDTGIFQVVITVPPEIDDEALQRGEEITLTYNDWGPSGSDYVGDKDEEITAVAYTSDFGASIELDQKVYTWTDKVYITIVAPDHNFDADQVDEIGGQDADYPINIKTQEAEIEGYKLVETGADTGIFSGELILTGVEHDDLDRETKDSSGYGPTDGQLAAEDSDGLAVVFENSDGDIVRASAIIQWNVGEVEWLEASYPALGSGIVRVIDPDMNLNPEAVDNFDVNVWSDSDVGGISLTVTETNAATGIFEGTVFFDDSSISSGHRLNVEEGDTVVAEYDDVTSPIEDETSVSATTLIGTIVPPLERAPINNLRAVDTFDNSIGAASVGQQVVITADLSNGQDRDQKFIFLIQVQDENGVTVSLNWVLGTLAAGQSFSPGASWTPTEAGTYDVTAFVWESIDNPTALSPTATIALTVN